MRFLAVAALSLLAFGCGGQELEVNDDELPLAEIDELGESTDALSGCSPDSGAESFHVQHINDRRDAIGKNRLAVAACVKRVARAWSLKMCRDNNLAHRPNLARAIDSSCSGAWRKLGENVGRGSTAQSLWQAFMDSPHHKDNIQLSGWNKLGVGAYKAGNGTLFITHNFAQF